MRLLRPMHARNTSAVGYSNRSIGEFADRTIGSGIHQSVDVNSTIRRLL